MKTLNELSKNAHWLLRIAIASVFIYHGLDKLPKLAPLAKMLDMSVTLIVLVASAEITGGLLVLIGGFTKDWITRLGAILIIPVMLGAILMAHWGQWSFIASKTHPMGGMEFQVTLLLISFYILIKGNNLRTSETVTNIN